jgi:GNAT superfamily N-acetyltransferase
VPYCAYCSSTAARRADYNSPLTALNEEAAVQDVEYRRDNFLISTDKSRLQLEVIHDFLKASYWAKNIPFAVVQKSVEHSLCYGVYDGDKQVGFARVITDYTTFAYLADVFILEPYRRQGLSKWMVACILAHPELQGLRRWLLATKDAHGLYRQFGFGSLRSPDSWMEIANPNAYSLSAG